MLIASFGMHAIALEHDHPGHSNGAHATESDSLGNYIHGTDKKLFLFAVLSFLFLGVIFRNIAVELTKSMNVIQRRSLFLLGSTRSMALRLYDHHLALYRVGILNTKAY